MGISVFGGLGGVQPGGGKVGPSLEHYGPLTHRGVSSSLVFFFGWRYYQELCLITLSLSFFFPLQKVIKMKKAHNKISKTEIKMTAENIKITSN